MLLNSFGRPRLNYKNNNNNLFILVELVVRLNTYAGVVDEEEGEENKHIIGKYKNIENSSVCAWRRKKETISSEASCFFRLF